MDEALKEGIQSIVTIVRMASLIHLVLDFLTSNLPIHRGATQPLALSTVPAA